MDVPTTSTWVLVALHFSQANVEAADESVQLNECSRRTLGPVTLFIALMRMHAHTHAALIRYVRVYHGITCLLPRLAAGLHEPANQCNALHDCFVINSS
jgi:hypothetical protein